MGISQHCNSTFVNKYNSKTHNKVSINVFDTHTFKRKWTVNKHLVHITSRIYVLQIQKIRVRLIMRPGTVHAIQPQFSVSRHGAIVSFIKFRQKLFTV